MPNDVNGRSPGGGWTSPQAYVIAVICLLIGIAAGYLLRRSARPQVAQMATAAPTVSQAAQAATAMPNMPGQIGMGGMGRQNATEQQNTTGQQITPQQLKYMAETQAAPMIERLKSEPRNALLLADIGNLYYDTQQYQLAVSYYQRSLKIQPGNTNVRVDLGTAMWYLGNPDKAIEEYSTVLKAEPTKPNALMNLGVVEWQAKMNASAAVAAWEKLLATNPNFEGKDKVEHLIAQAKKHMNLPPAAKTGTSPN